jgi:hypothetical protein
MGGRGNARSAGSAEGESRRARQKLAVANFSRRTSTNYEDRGLDLWFELPQISFTFFVIRFSEGLGGRPALAGFFTSKKTVGF